jgi:hypothetical protein
VLGTAQQEPVDDPEHRRIGAESEGEGEDDRRAEGATLAQRTENVADVVHEVLQSLARGDAFVLLEGAGGEQCACLLDVAKAGERFGACVARAQSSGFQLRGSRIDVKRDLAIDVGAGEVLATQRESQEPADARSNPRHAAIPWRAR